MDKVYEATWTDIENQQKKDNADYLGITKDSKEHVALAWDKLLSGSVKINLNELGVKVIAQLFENINATLFIDAEALVNFNNIYSSTLKVTIKRWLGEKGKDYSVDDENNIVKELTNNEKRRSAETVLTFYYDGSVNTSYSEFRGAIYIDTDIFGIGQVKLDDITVIWTEVFKYLGTDMFGSETIKSVYKFFGLDENGQNPKNAYRASNAAPSGEHGKVFNVAQNAAGDDVVYLTGEGVTAKTYLDVMFYKGELGISVAKSAVLNVLNLLAGIDLTDLLRAISRNV